MVDRAPFFVALAVCLGLVAAACSGSTTNEAVAPAASDGDEAGEVDDVVADAEASDDGAEPQPSPSVDGDSEYIFDQSELRTYELTLDPELLAQIDADPSAEEWVTGSLTFEGETIEGVGIRYKGSIGAFVGCLDGPQALDPSGAKTCTKLSMKIDINHTQDDLLFFEQRNLQFHAMNMDPTKMRERLGYWLFREMGVPAPRAVHARLMINGEFAGLFVLVEEVDGRFTREHFDDGTGNLYKEVWPTTSDGLPSPVEALEAGLRTNEDDPPTFDLMTTFASELVAAEGSETQAVIDGYMNVDEVMRYIAVDRTIRHDDGPFHWYCFEICEPHNFYLYENPSAESIHLVAWDLDNAFENISGFRNPVTPIADAWNETRNNCEPFGFGSFNLRQRSAACDPVVAAWTQYDDVYELALAEFVDGPFSEDVVNARIDEWAAQIAVTMSEADLAHDDAPSTDSWNAEIVTFREDLATARANVISELGQ